ncbi:MAG TPA: NAD(+)/NADH kinase [Candidatus Bathyarchaeia archaeon]|nr:NAD(+)/NADH kinase [Candidatus Bathyarchaeia archaeon]
MTKTVGIIAKSGSKEIANTAKKIYHTIQRHGLSVVPDENLARMGKLPGGKLIRRIKADLLVTVGGDGTVLQYTP